jgi:putative redox protein
MKSTINCNWKNGMAFEAEVNGFKLMMDADPAVGGQEQGPRPKPLTLVALAGCTSMDVISILKKMRIEPEYFNVRAEGEVAEEHPKYFTKIHLIYEFKGKDLPMDKLQKAIDLSQDRYCGVSYMLRQSSDLTFEILILE